MGVAQMVQGSAEIHVFTLTSPGRAHALDMDHVATIRAWMSEFMMGSWDLEPVMPGSVGFQVGGVIRMGCEVDAFFFRVRWAEMVSSYRVFEVA